MSQSSPFRRSPQLSFTLVAIALVAVLGILLAWITDWPAFAIWIVAISIITFLMYGYDKSQAQRGGWRVPENVFHGLALAGGFLGGWAGRIVFHHKTRKPIFTIVLAFSTLIYLVLAILLFAS
jgi:uncharacterized membrane protein YsdA (DUF1294 family)